MIEKPEVTIILPIRNENGHIRQALEAVMSQDWSRERMQVLVVDGMSDDGTREVVREFPRVRLIDNLGRIVPTGMNAALREAVGEIVIRVDGHCAIAPDYVRKCVEHITHDHVDGVGGPMLSIGETQLAETIALGMSSKFGVGDSSFRTEVGQTKFVDSVPFPAYTREIIQKAGLYDEELVRNQDDEYNYRIRQLGGKILLAEDIKSKYYSRGTLTSLWKQYFQYGYWKVRVLQKHPKQMRWRQFIPPIFVGSLLASVFLAISTKWGIWILSGIVGSYAIANLVASVMTSSRKGLKQFPLLPVVYSILHISYGLGFLVGLIKFANRWGDKTGKVPAL